MNSLEHISNDLRIFWATLGGTRFMPASTCAKRLSLLKTYSQKSYYFKHRMDVRGAFDKVKRRRCHLEKRKCFVCRESGEVRHHIIPINGGGTNAKRNVVPLCRPCHAEIHPWLKKI